MQKNKAMVVLFLWVWGWNPSDLWSQGVSTPTVVMISTVRPALVWIDGEIRGQTVDDSLLPFGQLKPGKNKFRLVYGPGDEETRTIDVQAGKTRIEQFDKPIPVPPPLKTKPEKFPPPFKMIARQDQAEGGETLDWVDLEPEDLNATPEFRDYKVYKWDTDGKSLSEASQSLETRDELFWALEHDFAVQSGTQGSVSSLNFFHDSIDFRTDVISRMFWIERQWDGRSEPMFTVVRLFAIKKSIFSNLVAEWKKSQNDSKGSTP